MPRLAPFLRIATLCALAAQLPACSNAPPPPLETTPTFATKTAPPSALGAPLVIGPVGGRAKVSPGPRPPQTAPTTTPTIVSPPLPLAPSSEALSLEQVTLPAFINEVFSKALRLNVQIDQTVMTRTDLVTLRTGKSLPAKQLFAMAQDALADYGIGLSWDGTVLHVAPDQKLMAEMPSLIRGRALPEVPAALRPIFQIIDLHQVSANDMMQWLVNAFGTNLRLSVAPSSNAIMIFGLPQHVQAAVEAVQVLDQARLAGSASLRVSPVFWTAGDLAGKLVQVLKAEGYDASASRSGPPTQTTAITIVPVEANNSLIAFAADPKVLDHIRQWIADLDQPGQVDPSHNIFVYFVQNTTAASLGNTVQGVLGGQAQISAPAEAQLEQAGRTQALPTLNQGGQGLGQVSQFGQGMGQGSRGLGQFGQATTPTLPRLAETEAQPSPSQPPTTEAKRGGPRLVVDSARNALVFIGSAPEYERIRPLLLALDKPPREALVEVTVAELSLNDQDNLGVEWTEIARLSSNRIAQFGTGPNVLTPFGASGGSSSGVGLPLGTSGFNYTILNNLGDVRLVLNAFSQNNRLTVLSTPRVLAESGQVAHIEVGTEVPIVTSQGTTNVIQNAGTTGILQSIEYRKTGVLLAVRPVIHSGNKVDLAVSQEVSQALPNNTPGITSPLIQNRNVSTELALSDGQTVVIGGLISENRTDNETGVPYLKDIPGVGLLFRNEALSKLRTELLVFITPYVISNDNDAAAITHQFQNQLRSWPVPSTRLHW